MKNTIIALAANEDSTMTIRVIFETSEGTKEEMDKKRLDIENQIHHLARMQGFNASEITFK